MTRSNKSDGSKKHVVKGDRKEMIKADCPKCMHHKAWKWLTRNQLQCSHCGHWYVQPKKSKKGIV